MRAPSGRVKCVFQQLFAKNYPRDPFQEIVKRDCQLQ